MGAYSTEALNRLVTRASCLGHKRRKLTGKRLKIVLVPKTLNRSSLHLGLPECTVRLLEAQEDEPVEQHEVL